MEWPLLEGELNQTTIIRNARLDYKILSFSYHLIEPCINNGARYKPLVIYLELVIFLRIQSINIYGDS